MKGALQIDSIEVYCELIGTHAQHPLINVTYLSELRSIPLGRKVFDFYCVFFNEKELGTVSYGRGTYSYQESTILFCAPGQTIGIDEDRDAEAPEGIILMLHPDYILGTSLGKKIQNFSFFNYDSNEALHMLEEEKATVKLLFRIIKSELDKPHDIHTKQIVCAQIGTLFNYCSRFYDRQFLQRQNANPSLIHRLDQILEDYFDSDEPFRIGIPTVQFCAGEVCLSPNYFGDLVKRITGKTAQEYIHTVIVRKAKFHLLETSMTISEIAYHLGFRYPHHLTRMFRKVTGMTPYEFRARNKT